MRGFGGGGVETLSTMSYGKAQGRFVFIQHFSLPDQDYLISEKHLPTLNFFQHNVAQQKRLNSIE